jgi:hypothetical protein
MRGNSKRYFFINKTAESEHLTHSPGDQWSEIQKHVQTGLKRPRRKGSGTPRKAHIVDDKALYNSTIRCISTEFDPFGTASVDIDSTVRSLLHYYIYNYHVSKLMSKRVTRTTGSPRGVSFKLYLPPLSKTLANPAARYF